MNRATGIVALLCGVGFGFGLAYSTMTRPEVVLDFLRGHDPGLFLVLGGAVAVSTVAYRWGPRLLRKPVLAAAFGKHQSVLSRQTIGGAALFGIGWGLGGVCPGAGIAGLGTGNWPLLIAVAGMLLGAYVQGWAASRTTLGARPGQAAGRPTGSKPAHP